MTSQPVASTYMPNVMLDAVRIGITGAAACEGPITLADFIDVVKSTADIEVVQLGEPNHIKIRMPVEEETTNQKLGKVELNLHFVKTAGTLRLTNRSCLTINPQKLIRGTLQGTPDGSLIGLDGNDNVLGPDQDRRALLAKALETTVEILDIALEFLNSCLPDGSEFRWDSLWIKSAEACRDVPRDNPEGDVRRAGHAAISGAVETIKRLYEPTTERLAKSPSLRWIKGKSQPEYKVYAKTEKLLRLEVAARERKAVLSLMESCGNADSPEHLGQLLLDFALQAEPLIDQLEAHVLESIECRRDISKLMTALLPLIELAAGGKQTRGPAPTQNSIQDARNAIDSLFLEGMFDARGTNRRHAVHTVLEKLTQDGGPLTRIKGKLVFYLLGSHALSAQQVMNSR